MSNRKLDEMKEEYGTSALAHATRNSLQWHEFMFDRLQRGTQWRRFRLNRSHGYRVFKLGNVRNGGENAVVLHRSDHDDGLRIIRVWRWRPRCTHCLLRPCTGGVERYGMRLVRVCPPLGNLIVTQQEHGAVALFEW